MIEANPTMVRDLLNLSYVKRWVVAPLHREQSVAEHSFRVMVILRGLWTILQHMGYPFDQHRALVEAMDHDLDEVYSGDMPGPVKDAGGKQWPDPSNLMRWEIAVKVADSLETWYWWYIHGDRTWTHPKKPASGRDCRDIRKILHYTREWPEMWDAVCALVAATMCVDQLTLQSTFDRKGPPYQL